MCSERGCKNAGSSRTVSPPSDKKVICWRGRIPWDSSTLRSRRLGFLSTRRTRAKTFATPSSGMLLPAMTSKQPVPPGGRSRPRIYPPSSPTVIGGAGFRCALDVALAAAVVHELFRSEIRLEPVSGRHDMLAYRFLMQAGVDRQHILEKLRDCRKRHMS